MIIVTTNDIPGYRIDHTLGECFGLTVRSRHIGSNIGASFKSLAGGELRGITELLVECRREALSRLASEAQARGGNGVVAFRFETTEYGQTGIEVCAYGTAVVVSAQGDGSQQAAPAAQGQPQQFSAPAPSGFDQGGQLGAQWGQPQPDGQR